MKISERIELTVERWRLKWGEALGNFLLGTIARGGTKLLEDFEPDAIDSVKDILEKVKADPNTPDDLKALIEKVLTPGNPLVVVLGILFVVSLFTGTLAALFAPVNRATEYKVDRLIESFRLDPLTITAAWLRDKPGYEWLWDDLEERGWSDDKIAVAKELAKIIPPLADMVRFADFSAFDPEVIAKWREFYDAPSWVLDPMSLIGITNEAPRDWANKYWFSHYVQPGRYELGEMLRRSKGWELNPTPENIAKSKELGVTEEDLALAYRTMAYSEFWQKRLIELAKEVPTRVDVRRWWDMRTIDEVELWEIYQRQGYFGKDLENYVRWTKVYTDFPMMMARFKNGWITEEDIRTWLRGLEIPEERITQFIEEKTKPEAPARVEAERDLTITDIIMWLKKYPDERERAIELIMDLGYSRWEAEFKIDARIAAEAGSPETYEEFKDLTQKWRKAVGMEAEPMTEELKAAAAEVVRVTREVETLERSIVEEKRGLVAEEELPTEAIAKLKELRVSLHRAEAELARLKSEYTRLVAEWKYKEV